MLDFASQREELFAADRVGPARFEVACQPCGSLNAHELDYRIARIHDLFTQLFGPMKERRGEKIRIAGWVAVLPISQILFENRHESRIVVEPSHQGVEQRSEAADPGRE